MALVFDMAAEFDLIIVGYGMAASRLLDELVSRSYGQSIAVIGEESSLGYNRILLSHVLSGETDGDAIRLHEQDWLDQHGITWIHNQVHYLDSSSRQLVCADGQCFRYGRCVIATGSHAMTLPQLSAAPVPQLALRTLADADRCIQLARQRQHILVVGAGLLGLEAAYGLVVQGRAHNSNLKVTVLHRSSHLLNRQLDADAAALLQHQLEALAIEFILADEVAKVVDLEPQQPHDDPACMIHTQKGRTLCVNAVVYGMGIQPNAQLGLSSQGHIQTHQGLVVDGWMRTSAPDVFALGECCEHEGQTFGLVAPIYEQAKILAQVLNQPQGTQSSAGSCAPSASNFAHSEVFRGSPRCANDWHASIHDIEPFIYQQPATSLKISGVQLYSCGSHTLAQGALRMHYQDPTQGIYRALYLKRDRLVGVVLLGNIQDGQWYAQLIEQQTAVDDMTDRLLFGQAHVSPA